MLDSTTMLKLLLVLCARRGLSMLSTSQALSWSWGQSWQGSQGTGWEGGELGACCPSALVHSVPEFMYTNTCARTHFPPLHFCSSLFPPSLSTLSPCLPLIGQIPKVGITWSENSNMFKFFTAMLNCFSKMLYIYPPTIHEEKSSWSIFCASFDRRKLTVQRQEHPASTVTVTDCHCEPPSPGRSDTWRSGWSHRGSKCVAVSISALPLRTGCPSYYDRLSSCPFAAGIILSTLTCPGMCFLGVV